METYRSGHNGADSKSVCGQPHVGSNPTVSANLGKALTGLAAFTATNKEVLSMEMLQNLHTHTIYCDGKNQPEEMIRYAIEKGFDSLGFSGHSWMPFVQYANISLENTEKYKDEIRMLKEKYRDELDIYLGLEVDVYSGVDVSDYDYIIGSVHFVKSADEYLEVDHSLENFKRIVKTNYGGNAVQFAKDYFATVAQLPQYGTFDFIGHFDLITKFIEVEPLFDQSCKEYLDSAYEAIDALKGKIPLFEVNTGAIARGYRTAPYPSIPLIKEFKRQDFGVVITSDCHDGSQLDCNFKEVRELLMECGFKEKYVLTPSGFQAVAI